MTDDADQGSLENRMRAALRTAIVTRESIALSVLRSVLGVVDNASSVDVVKGPDAHQGYIAGGVAGLGAGEVPRRELSAEDVAAIVKLEVANRDEAANDYDALGRPEEARRLRAESAVLKRLLGDG